MKLRTLAACVAALAAALLLPTSSHAGPTAQSTVAVMANGDYVDLGPVTNSGEVANLVEDLTAQGHTVRQFDDITAAGLTAALDGADVLAIPELEPASPGDFADALGAEGIAVIQAFVDAGGRILFFGDSGPAADINGIFGFSVVDSDACDYEWPDDEADEPVQLPCDITADAASTEFADGPAQLLYANGTTGLLSASLPTGSTVIYEITIDTEGLIPVALEDLAAVASMPYGDGAVIFLGWDWFPEVQTQGELGGVALRPAGVEEEAAWASVLGFAVSQPNVTAAGGTNEITFTSDSPSTQPIFVEVVVDGVTETLEIAPGTTSVIMAVAGPTAAAFTVPGWGVGEGSAQVAGTAVTPTPAPAAPPAGAPAQPVVAAPSFTG